MALLGELLSHPDLALRSQTRHEIKLLQEETGYTTVFVTCDQLESLSLTDWIALMNDGVIQQVGTPEEIYNDLVNLFVAEFVGDPPMNQLAGELQTTGYPRGRFRCTECAGGQGLRLRGSARGWHLNMTLPGVRRIIVETASEMSFEKEGMMRIKLDPAKTYLFDVESGERVK